MLSLCNHNRLDWISRLLRCRIGVVLLVACGFIVLVVPTEIQPTALKPSSVNGQGAWASTIEETPTLTQTVYLPYILNAYPIVYPHRITTPGIYSDIQPRFSPDGKFIVFVSDRDGYSDVFSVRSTGGSVVNLTQSLARSEDTPVFSPDGTTIAYASNNTTNGDWDIFLMNPDGSNKRVAVGYSDSDELHPWFSLDGQYLYFSSNIAGNWEIYRTEVVNGTVYYTWIQLTYNPATDRFPVLSPDGSTVVFRSDRDGNSEIYLMNTNGSNQRRFTTDPASDSYGSYIPDMSGIVYDSNRSGTSNSYLANPAGTGVITFETRLDWQMMHSSVSVDGLWRVYASKMDGGTSALYVDRFISPLTAIGQKGEAAIQDNCDWEAGTLAYGWSRAWETTHQIQYLEWLQAYVDRCVPGKTISHVNDALLGYAALVVYQNDPRPLYLDFAQNVADWLMLTALRTPDGTLSHINDGDGVWCDTMLSVPPFLVKMSQVVSDTMYFDEAVSQVLKHANHLQDPTTGLYHHAWSASQNLYIGPAYWSRGNGWVLVGDVAVLSAMTDTHPSRVTLLNIYRKQAESLELLQNSTGLWPNVVNHADYYLETSGTALIGYAFKQGIAAGWLDNSQYVTSTEAARLGVWRKTLADGMVMDVQAGTGPRADDAIYNTLPHTDLQLFGQGVALLVGSP